MLSQQWTFALGALQNVPNAEVASTINATGFGGRVDLSDLGADEKYLSPFFSVRWRPSQRWRWDFSYQNLKLDGLREAAYEINFSNIIIPVGWTVRSELKAHLYSATVGYAFYRTPKTEFGGLVGLHIFDTSADIEGSIFVGNARVSRAARIGEVLPVPTLGLYGTYAFNRWFSLEGKAQYLSANYAGYGGDILIADAAVNFSFLDNATLALGYKYIDINISHNGDYTSDTYSVDFGGPYVNLAIGF